MSMMSRSRARARERRRRLQAAQEKRTLTGGNRGLNRAERSRPVGSNPRADVQRNKGIDENPVKTSRALAQQNRSSGSGRENARGSGVSADIAAVDGNVSRRDRGGIGAGERGANLAGFAGTVTPGQKRGEKQTEAGKFPVYGKQMQAAQSFRGAFAQARGQGKKVFEWQGRKYTTDLA